MLQILKPLEKSHVQLSIYHSHENNILSHIFYFKEWRQTGLCSIPLAAQEITNSMLLPLYFTEQQY